MTSGVDIVTLYNSNFSRKKRPKDHIRGDVNYSFFFFYNEILQRVSFEIWLENITNCQTKRAKSK